MDGKQIFELINNFKNSSLYSNMLIGKRYYLGRNDILTRQFFFYNVNDKETVDTYRANIKTPSNFIQPIIDHKISYCFSKDIILEDFPTNSIDINEEIDFVAEEAAKTSIGWLYIYVDEDKFLQVKSMESETIIPLYDGTIENKLTSIIRFYKLGECDYAEFWDNISCDTYQLNKSNYDLINSISHKWGMLPFIPFYNNRNGTNDIEGIKSLIDAYDIILSDFNNNFIDFQEVILFIKNYAENVATKEAAIELMAWLKKYKVVAVKQDGSIDIIAKEVPFQARKEIMMILRRLIYETAQAVDLDELKGGSLTNVVIKAYFIFFDLKCSKTLKQAKKFIKEILKFSNKYNELRSEPTSPITAANITFNKNILINEDTTIESCVKSDGIISKRTLLANHPWVTDVDIELLQLDEDLLNDSVNDLTGGGSVNEDVEVK